LEIESREDLGFDIVQPLDHAAQILISTEETTGDLDLRTGVVSWHREEFEVDRVVFGQRMLVLRNQRKKGFLPDVVVVLDGIRDESLRGGVIDLDGYQWKRMFLFRNPLEDWTDNFMVERLLLVTNVV